MKRALALDVGGTKIYNAIIDENGNISGEVEKHSTPKTLNEIIAVFKNIISKYENQVDIIAFSTCGAVNNENTRIIGSTGNIAKGYSDIDFQNLSKKPVFVENDANCAAWAEYEIGASKGCNNSVLLTLGTGVGGGIIVDGRLLKGKSGAAGEMHFRIRTDNKRKCSCGNWDCYEIYCSGTGLKLTGEEISGNKNITTYDIVDGYKSGDKLMTEIFNRWQNDILAGMTGLANIFDPDCIVLSGSMAQFVDTDYLTQEVNRVIITSPTKVVKASAGNYSGMIGAGLLAFRKGF